MPRLAGMSDSQWQICNVSRMWGHVDTSHTNSWLMIARQRSDWCRLVQLKRCPHSDISPCPQDPQWVQHGDTWTRYPIDFPHVLEGMEQDHPEDHLADTFANSTGNSSITLHI